MIDYGIEFDQKVYEINEKLKNPNKNYVQAFLRGFFFLKDNRDKIPTTEQSAINLGSNWKRVEEKLEKIISEKKDGEVNIKEAKQGIPFVQDLYNTYRNIYIQIKSQS